MESLLLLVHRIPYPPNKGDKVRSFNLLKFLAKDYRIFLGTFVDDAHDLRYRADVAQYCEDVCLVPVHSGLRKFKSLAGLLRGDALSVHYYRHRRMTAWVREVLSTSGISRVVVYSSAMAQYVCEPRATMHKVIDFVDVDSQKWHQYAQRRRWPMRWLYRRESKKLLDFDRYVAQRFDACVLVSRPEADLFRRLVPEAADRTIAMENGVDTEFFSPDRQYPNPYPDGAKVLVFTGAMDYWANVDAVSWFAREIFPAVRRRVPDACFFIVGARPADGVRRLQHIDGVHVTGAVKEIRPFIYHAAAAVAPLRIARGLQNKVLEAMAMGKPVLATPDAMVGLQIDSRVQELVSDDPNILAEKAVALLQTEQYRELGAVCRNIVTAGYSWATNLRCFERLLSDGGEQPDQGNTGHCGKGAAGLTDATRREISM